MVKKYIDIVQIDYDDKMSDYIIYCTDEFVGFSVRSNSINKDIIKHQPIKSYKFISSELCEYDLGLVDGIKHMLRQGVQGLSKCSFAYATTNVNTPSTINYNIKDVFYVGEEFDSIKWEILDITGVVIHSGDIPIIGGQVFDEGFHVGARNYMEYGSSQQFYTLVFNYNDNAVLLDQIVKYKNQYGDKFPKSFWCNNEHLFWEYPTYNCLHQKIAKRYKKFKL